MKSTIIVAKKNEFSVLLTKLLEFAVNPQRRSTRLHFFLVSQHREPHGSRIRIPPRLRAAAQRDYPPSSHIPTLVCYNGRTTPRVEMAG